MYKRPRCRGSYLNINHPLCHPPTVSPAAVVSSSSLLCKHDLPFHPSQTSPLSLTLFAASSACPHRRKYVRPLYILSLHTPRSSFSTDAIIAHAAPTPQTTEVASWRTNKDSSMFSVPILTLSLTNPRIQSRPPEGGAYLQRRTVLLFPEQRPKCNDPPSMSFSSF